MEMPEGVALWDSKFYLVCTSKPVLAFYLLPCWYCERAYSHFTHGQTDPAQWLSAQGLVLKSSCRLAGSSYTYISFPSKSPTSEARRACGSAVHICCWNDSPNEFSLRKRQAKERKSKDTLLWRSPRLWMCQRMGIINEPENLDNVCNTWEEQLFEMQCEFMG